MHAGTQMDGHTGGLPARDRKTKTKKMTRRRTDSQGGQVTAVCRSEDVSLHNTLWLPCWGSSAPHNAAEGLILHPLIVVLHSTNISAEPAVLAGRVLHIAAASLCQPAGSLHR